MAENDFEQVFGGYSRDQADRLIEGMKSRIDAVKTENEQLRDQVERSESELVSRQARVRDLAAHAERLPARPSFEKLGSQFEEVIRLGEEKASRLVSDARAEADSLRTAAQIRGAELTREAEQRANTILNEAHDRVARTRQEAEGRASQVVAQANERLQSAEDRVASSRHEADAIRLKTEAEIAESREALERFTVAERAAVAEFAARVRAEREQMREDLRVRMAQFEREHERRQLEASQLSARLLAEAEQKVSEILESSRSIESESEALAMATQVRTEQIIGQARRIAGGILDQAQQRAAEFSGKASRYSDMLVARGSARLDDLRQERELIEGFMHDLTESAQVEVMLQQLDAELAPKLPSSE